MAVYTIEFMNNGNVVHAEKGIEAHSAHEAWNIACDRINERCRKEGASAIVAYETHAIREEPEDLNGWEPVSAADAKSAEAAEAMACRDAAERKGAALAVTIIQAEDPSAVVRKVVARMSGFDVGAVLTYRYNAESEQCFYVMYAIVDGVHAQNELACVATSEERLFQHWKGFIENLTKPASAAAEPCDHFEIVGPEQVATDSRIFELRNGAIVHVACGKPLPCMPNMGQHELVALVAMLNAVHREAFAAGYNEGMEDAGLPASKISATDENEDHAPAMHELANVMHGMADKLYDTEVPASLIDNLHAVAKNMQDLAGAALDKGN